MIKSITFTGESGYIISKIPEPNEPHCMVRRFGRLKTRDFTDEEKKEIKEYKKKYKEWEKHKDDYMNPQLVKNLIGRTFEFEPGKINLIFGPNASGKTTILKALAGNANISDGFSTLAPPIDIRAAFGEIKQEDFRKFLDKRMKNSAKIEWDGTPIYYDNFANRQSHGCIGDMLGSVLGDDIGTEIMYIMSKNQISNGQNSIFLLNRLMNIAGDSKCYADIFKKYVNENKEIKIEANDIWKNVYEIQLKYYLGFENSFEKKPITFLFDEIDKSMDISNIYHLYTVILPELVKKTGVQIIIISHSPLVLSDKIMKSKYYNFISIDEDYTKACIENIKNLF